MANQTESEQYAFNAFANLPFYGSINSEFIELANVYDKKSTIKQKPKLKSSILS